MLGRWQSFACVQRLLVLSFMGLLRPVLSRQFEDVVKMRKYPMDAVNGTGGIRTYTLVPGDDFYCTTNIFYAALSFKDPRRVAYSPYLTERMCGTCLEVCADLGCEYVMLWDRTPDQNALWYQSVPQDYGLLVNAGLRKFLTSDPPNGPSSYYWSFEGSWWPVEQIYCREIDPDFYRAHTWDGWKDYNKKNWVFQGDSWFRSAWKWPDFLKNGAQPHARVDQELYWAHIKMWKLHHKRIPKMLARWSRNRLMQYYGSRAPNPNTKLNFSCADPFPNRGPPQGAAFDCRGPENWPDEPIQHQSLGKPINASIDAAEFKEKLQEAAEPHNPVVNQASSHSRRNDSVEHSNSSSATAHNHSRRWESRGRHLFHPTEPVRLPDPHHMVLFDDPRDYHVIRPKNHTPHWLLPTKPRYVKSKLLNFFAGWVAPGDVREHSRLFNKTHRAGHLDRGNKTSSSKHGQRLNQTERHHHRSYWGPVRELLMPVKVDLTLWPSAPREVQLSLQSQISESERNGDMELQKKYPLNVLLAPARKGNEMLDPQLEDGHE